MKRERILSCLNAAFLAFCLGFGGVACMVTGLKLPVNWPLLIIGCALGAVIPAVCLSFKRGGWVLLGTAGLYALLMWRSDAFWAQLKALLYSALSYYHHGYGFPIPDWIQGAKAETQILPLLLIAGLVMTAAARAVVRSKRALPAAAAALLPLATCLVVTDTVPAVFAILILLLGIVLLMMTQSVRRQDAAQGNRLTGILILPVIAGLILLTLAVPQGGYNAPGQSNLLDTVYDWISQIIPQVGQTSDGELVVSFGGDVTDQVDLSQIGRKKLQSVPVMELTADYDGIVYLRGRDYDIYNGLSWTADETRIEEGFGPPENWTTSAGQLSLRTIGRRDVFYTPYYQAEQQTLHGGMVPNDGYMTEYSYQCRSLRNDWQLLWQLDYVTSFNHIESTEPPADARYLELPDETREQATAILTSLIADSAPENKPELAQAIGEYVQNSADYDLNTNRMPADETDFAIWFLEESDTGYCVHFATSATVLLRAAGIPARYVEGYFVQTRAGETTIVREQMAHAWVEYYLDRVGWVTLDPTPSASDTPSDTLDPTQTTTAPTAPAPTIPSTEETTLPQASTSAAQPDTQSTGGTSASEPPGSSEEKTIPGWFLLVLQWLAFIAALVFLVIGQWALRRYLKLKRMYQGKANAQALARYRELRRITKLLKLPLPDAIQALAEKARYSQHTLTKGELAQFDLYLREGTNLLQERPWYFKIVYRFIFAVY